MSVTGYLCRAYFVVVYGDDVQILRSNNNSRVNYDRRRGQLWTFRTTAHNLCGRRGDISTGPRIPGSWRRWRIMRSGHSIHTGKTCVRLVGGRVCHRKAEAAASPPGSVFVGVGGWRRQVYPNLLSFRHRRRRRASSS